MTKLQITTKPNTVKSLLRVSPLLNIQLREGFFGWAYKLCWGVGGGGGAFTGLSIKTGNNKYIISIRRKIEQIQYCNLLKLKYILHTCRYILI